MMTEQFGIVAVEKKLGFSTTMEQFVNADTDRKLASLIRMAR